MNNIAYGDQGDGLWLEDPDNPVASFGAGTTAILNARRFYRWKWEVTLNTEEYGEEWQGTTVVYETKSEDFDLERAIGAAREYIHSVDTADFWP